MTVLFFRTLPRLISLRPLERAKRSEAPLRFLKKGFTLAKRLV
jgi:hypothetical protein